jgi:hypothetical protein
MTNVADRPRAGQARFHKYKIKDAFIARPAEMLASQAWKVLNLSERRILDRLDMEHVAHGFKENGKLPVTYEDFMAYGVRRDSIPPSLRVLGRLRLAQITRPGRAGNAEHRYPNLYELTYQPTYSASNGFIEPSHDWRRIRDRKEARSLAKEARKAFSPDSRTETFSPDSRTETASPKPGKRKQKPIHDSRTGLSPDSRTETGDFPVHDSRTTSSPDSRTTVYISMGGRAGLDSGGRIARTDQPVTASPQSTPPRRQPIPSVTRPPIRPIPANGPIRPAAAQPIRPNPANGPIRPNRQEPNPANGQQPRSRTAVNAANGYDEYDLVPEPSRSQPFRIEAPPDESVPADHPLLRRYVPGPPRGGEFMPYHLQRNGER